MKTKLIKALPYWGMGGVFGDIFIKLVQARMIKKGVPS
jgi:hypothetical protein